MLRNVPDDILDMATQAAGVNVRLYMDTVRSEFGIALPRDYDVGMVVQDDGRAVVMKLRITAGEITVREETRIRDWLADGNRQFKELLRELVIRTVVALAARVQK